MVDGIERLTFDTDQGRLAVLAAGPADGERMVLLHGIPAGARLFEAVLPLLAAADYRVFAPDMPGYGETRLADSADYSLSAVADRYARWLEQESLNPVWLVGHDLGCAVAQFMAVRYPHLLSRLTLANGPLGDSFPVPSVNLMIAVVRLGLFGPLAALRLIPNPVVTREIREGFAVPARLSDEMLRTVFWDSKLRDPQGRREFAKHLRHLRNTESVAVVPQLAHIPVPALVLWSDRDRFQPAETSGQRLLRALPDGTAYEVVPDGGHFVPLERPSEWVAKLLAWKNSLSASGV